MVYKIDQFIDGNIHVQEQVERGVARGEILRLKKKIVEEEARKLLHI